MKIKIIILRFLLREYLRRNPEKVDFLLKKLNKAAVTATSFEYGLPLYRDAYVNALRQVVLDWVEGLDKKD